MASVCLSVGNITVTTVATTVFFLQQIDNASGIMVASCRCAVAVTPFNFRRNLATVSIAGREKAQMTRSATWWLMSNVMLVSVVLFCCRFVEVVGL